jgi:hypothetical protein
MSENKWITRWSRAEINAMLLEQRKAFWQREIGVERTQLAELERVVELPHAVVISGLR